MSTRLAALQGALVGRSAAPAADAGRESLDFAVSPRVTRAAALRPPARERHDPLVRPLRIYTLDPTAGVLEGATAVANVPYEKLEPGPVGAFLRVIDDGLTVLSGERLPDPLDLDAPHVLIGQGRRPSITDSHFRAQMAYAVCSATRAAFRRALGREPAWGFDGQRLLVRSSMPGLRNAFYDSGMGEIQLGAFLGAEEVLGRNVRGQVVSTVLSHDIVVHEMAHAMLDGMRAQFLRPSNPDVLAFHEAFADIVALFQRFAYREVVGAAIRKTRGDLDRESVLVQIGRQFAQAAGVGDALRTAILDGDRHYDPALEPHVLGEVLLAAVFGAYRTVFQRKSSRYVRLATGGTGVLPDGELPELLAERLTEVASDTAQQFLTICIRAIDYCPPVDITFGEYLRAVITADADLVPDDPWGYREAWIDAFRARGIVPSDVRALTQDALLWELPDADLPPIARLSFSNLRFGGDPAQPASADALREQALSLGAFVTDPRHRACFGFGFAGDPRLEGDAVGLPTVESIRTSRRVGPDGQVLFDLVAEVIQHRRVAPGKGGPGFDFHGGSTIIIDPMGVVRYVIRKSVLREERIRRQRDFVGRGRVAFWREQDDFAEPVPAAFLRLHAVRDLAADVPHGLTPIPRATLAENQPKVTRTATGGAWAYPLGEPNRPGREGAPGPERARALIRIVDWLAVDQKAHTRYQPGDKKTFCNIYAADYCYLAGVYLPRVWWTKGTLTKIAAGEAPKPVLGETVVELTANRLFDWLGAFGPQFGWKRVSDPALAQEAANAGGVAVICAQRADPTRSGHITVVVPTHEGHASVTDALGVVPLQSQAGAVNRRWFASRWWPAAKFKAFAFWVHG